MIKLFENFQSDEEIMWICNKYGININYYTINPDRSISVDYDVALFDKGLYQLPLRFKEVSGNFDCDANELDSLEGSPDFVGGGFDCDNNKLKSLVGGPKRVNGNYFCQSNDIMTFHGFPEHTGGGFHCANNPIEYIWDLFRDFDKIELINEMDPLRVIDGEPHVIIDILNDFLSIIGKPEVKKISGYYNI